jgi:hypothetical protein
VPGHEDIKGNEKADEEAKKASTEHQTGEQTILKAAIARVAKATIHQNWDNEWHKGQEDAKRLHNIGKTPNTMPGPKIYSQLESRRDIAWIARLRTGHVSLNKYLYRFGNHPIASQPIRIYR